MNGTREYPIYRSVAQDAKIPIGTKLTPRISVGDKFGKLTVVGLSNERGSDKCRKIKCICDCGRNYLGLRFCLQRPCKKAPCFSTRMNCRLIISQ